jgi:hypothetical protein
LKSWVGKTLKMLFPTVWRIQIFKIFCSTPTMIAPRGRRKIRWIEIIQAVNLTSPPQRQSPRNCSGHAFLSSELGRFAAGVPAELDPSQIRWGIWTYGGLYSLTDLDSPHVFYHIHCIVLYFEYCIKGLHEYADLRSADGGVLNLRKVEFAECWIRSDTGPASVRPAMSSATSNSANRAILARSSSTRSQASRKRQRTVDQPSKIIYKDIYKVIQKKEVRESDCIFSSSATLHPTPCLGVWSSITHMSPEKFQFPLETVPTWRSGILAELPISDLGSGPL